ncbi:MAG: tRNA pseudouridine(55) synthase TruB [Limnochordales bacterium]|nr:tRNA pseudouridine(55) synthase TruB [Limnochordales bacterium]
MDLSGFLNVIKPAGPTSHDLVVEVRRLLPGIKVGHLGTLDPLAAGVLPLALGSATRLADYAHHHRKTYRAEFLLGVETESGDLDGEVVATAPEGLVVPVAEVWSSLRQFTGEILQRPPVSSAIRIAGRRSYERARAGEAVEPPARKVAVYRWQWLATWRRDGTLQDGPLADESTCSSTAPLAAGDRLLFEIECSAGTYVRALARDLGRALGLRATLSYLLRTRVGPFSIADAVSPAELASLLKRGEGLKERAAVLAEAGLIKPARFIWPAQLPRLVIPETLLPRLRNGQTILQEAAVDAVRSAGSQAGEATEVLIETEAGQAVAIGIFCGPGRFRARRMLV